MEQTMKNLSACYGCMCVAVWEYCDDIDRCCGSCEDRCRVIYPDATCSGKCYEYFKRFVEVVKTTTTTTSETDTPSMVMQPNSSTAQPRLSDDFTTHTSTGVETMIFAVVLTAIITGMICLVLLKLYFKCCPSNTNPPSAPSDIESSSPTDTSTTDVTTLSESDKLIEEPRESSYSGTHGSLSSGAQPTPQHVQEGPASHVSTRKADTNENFEENKGFTPTTLPRNSGDPKENHSDTSPNSTTSHTTTIIHYNEGYNPTEPRAPGHTTPNNQEDSTISPTTSMSQMNASDRTGGDQVNEGYSTLPKNPGHTTPSLEDSTTSPTTSMSQNDASESIDGDHGDSFSSAPKEQNSTFSLDLTENLQQGQSHIPDPVHDSKLQQEVSMKSTNNYDSNSVHPTLSSDDFVRVPIDFES